MYIYLMEWMRGDLARGIDSHTMESVLLEHETENRKGWENIMIHVFIN